MTVWTRQDLALLRRVRAGFPNQIAAATALGLPQGTLSRYLSGRRKPTGTLAISMLRQRISAELTSNKKSESESSEKDAEP